MKIGFAVRLVVCAAVALHAAVASCADFGEDDEYMVELDRWYAGASASLVLPQGGSQMRRLAGGAAYFGCYLDEFLAIEGEASWMEDCAGLALRGLWHWYGYERLDPFFTFGAKGWIEGDAGPCGGAGFFWHLDDHWSLRFDAEAVMGLDGGVSMIYGFSAGIRRSF